MKGEKAALSATSPPDRAPESIACFDALGVIAGWAKAGQDPVAWRLPRMRPSPPGNPLEGRPPDPPQSPLATRCGSQSRLRSLVISPQAQVRFRQVFPVISGKRHGPSRERPRATWGFPEGVARGALRPLASLVRIVIYRIP